MLDVLMRFGDRVILTFAKEDDYNQIYIGCTLPHANGFREHFPRIVGLITFVILLLAMHLASWS